MHAKTNTKRREHPTAAPLGSKRSRLHNGSTEKSERKEKKKAFKLPPAKEVVPPQFNVKDPKAYEYLDTHGYVVIEKVADDKECDRLVSLFWDYVEAACAAVRRSDPTTWSNANWPGLLSVGIFKYYGIGQSAFMWACRQQPAFREFYEKLYGGDTHLLTSFDGCGVFRGAEHKFDSKESWLHVDRNPRLHDAKHISVQGLLQLVDPQSTNDNGGFVCVPGTHKRMESNADNQTTFYAKSSDYLPIPPSHPICADILSGKCPVHVLRVPRGCAIFWHSSLIHCNQAPRTKTITGSLRRLVAYVCLAPLAYVPAYERRALIKAREAALQANTTTGHWATKLPKNERMLYPRSRTFNPILNPLPHSELFLQASALLRGN